MARDDDPPSSEVETAVPLVGGGITEENTSCGTRSKLVFAGGSHVGIAQTAENAKMSVVGGVAAHREHCSEQQRRGAGLGGRSP
jgi:hypothetical protein